MATPRSQKANRPKNLNGIISGNIERSAEKSEIIGKRSREGMKCKMLDVNKKARTSINLLIRCDKFCYIDFRIAGERLIYWMDLKCGIIRTCTTLKMEGNWIYGELDCRSEE